MHAMTRPTTRRLMPWHGVVLCLLLGLGATAAATTDTDTRWHTALRAQYFQDRAIVENNEVIALEAPYRAEDAAIVPLRIRAQIPQQTRRYIKTITLLIDNNPAPLVGRFHFTPRSGRADLALRARVNEYTPVRAVAETSDGGLYMARTFIKASGGCSAPVGTDLDAALQRLGKMRFRVKQTPLTEPLQTQIGISHPNITGMQMDQLTRMFAPAHYVTSVTVRFEGDPVFQAETDISVSENPNFRFFFVPRQAGQLEAEVTDNLGRTYTQTYRVKASN